MNTDEKEQILKAREYIVAKSNEIVQKSRYQLSVQEQKTIAYICSMIKPQTAVERAKGHPFILEYEFNIRDYCKICGIDYDSGKNYTDIKNVLKGLRDKSFWLKLEDGSETTISWVNKVWCNKGTGKAKIRLDEDMVPYLFDLQEKFVAYGLYNILAMKSQYSIRIYELIKSYAYQKSKTFDINELKHLLMVDNVKSYVNFKDFRKYVLEVAQAEINELTDLMVTYEPITKGRKVVKVKFNIETKSIKGRNIAILRVENKLDKAIR